MIVGSRNTTSPYLQRPVRTLRQACLDHARIRATVPPCRACESKRPCEIMTRHAHRQSKKRFIEARRRVPAAYPHPGSAPWKPAPTPPHPLDSIH